MWYWKVYNMEVESENVEEMNKMAAEDDASSSTSSSEGEDVDSGIAEEPNLQRPFDYQDLASFFGYWWVDYFQVNTQ